VPSEDIGPLLTGVLFADLALLLTVFLAVADDGDTPIVVFITDSNPGDAVGYGSELRACAIICRETYGGPSSLGVLRNYAMSQVHDKSTETLTQSASLP
jgi:hypothetical protein